ncbi:hypothetical protein [Fulvivirga sp. M361]|uniref:hypothetical protein n=1 Tax=Fulvivirga sp. M361 TaxID=2594266 RepID=UPI00162A2513|nr:hypothetical protein [Fulvivirga sp. M361]
MNLINKSLKVYPDTWYMLLSKNICHYFLGSRKKALVTLKKANELSLENSRRG